MQREEADQYAYEKSSLESLKAFEWLSLNHSSSSDESPVSVARVPRSYVPMSPPPSFRTSKEQTHKKTAAAAENPKNGRATSAPRPRAVLSSPDNDVIVGRKIQARKEQLPGLENRNRHMQCKIFPKSSAVDSFSPAREFNKKSPQHRSSIQAKSRAATFGDSSKRAGGVEIKDHP